MVSFRAAALFGTKPNAVLVPERLASILSKHNQRSRIEDGR